MKDKKNIINILLLLSTAISASFFGIIGMIISVILLILYIINQKEKNILQIIFTVLGFIGAIAFFNGLYSINTMTNKGIDGIGEAIINGVLISYGRLLLVICSLIIIIIDNRKIIFRKKVIISTIIIGILICLSIPIKMIITTKKVTDNIPTINDLKKELIERGFQTENYRLYGINKNNKKAIRLSFEENPNEKYPLYVYTVIDYPWIIYYANNEIYAARGEYWDYYTTYKKDSGYNEEKVIWEYPNEVISETSEISIYNPKINRYEKGDTITYTGFDYYSQNQIDNSIFIDIPTVKKWGIKIKKIDKITQSTLEN